MATQDYANAIQGVALRVTRLDAAGNLLNGPGDSYTTNAFLRVSFTPEYEEGDEITEKSASGAVCVSFKSPDTLKRITMELAVCDPDPELTQLLGGGVLLRKNLGTFASPEHKSVGWAAPAVGDDPSGNGVAIEAWARAIVGDKPAARLPYWKLILPYVKLRQSGDRALENGLMANTFEGTGLGNILYGTGPDDRWEWPAAAERPYMLSRVDWAPTGLRGFYTWHQGVTATVTNKALTSNVATITTSAAHGILAGDSVTVAGVDSTFNGTYTVLSVPTATTFTYAKTAANVTATSAAGTVTAPAGSRPVNNLGGVDADNDYNIPGNGDYDPNKDVDVVLDSVENPGA